MTADNIPDFVRRGSQRAEEPTSPITLEQVRKEASHLRDLYMKKEDLEARLAEIVAAINFSESRTLLDIMLEAKIPAFSLEADGNNPPAEFSRKQIVNASIPKEREGMAYVWLEENGHADLIKHAIKLQFNMGENARAKKLEALLSKNKFEYESKVSVLPQSLTAMVKREMEANRVVPQDLLGVYIGEKVEVKVGGKAWKTKAKK
jgi:hypothetical protein